MTHPVRLVIRRKWAWLVAMRWKWVGPPMTHQEGGDLMIYQQGRNQLIHQGVGLKMHHQEFEHQLLGQKKFVLVRAAPIHQQGLIPRQGA